MSSSSLFEFQLWQNDVIKLSTWTACIKFDIDYDGKELNRYLWPVSRKNTKLSALDNPPKRVHMGNNLNHFTRIWLRAFDWPLSWPVLPWIRIDNIILWIRIIISYLILFLGTLVSSNGMFKVNCPWTQSYSTSLLKSWNWKVSLPKRALQIAFKG